MQGNTYVSRDACHASADHCSRTADAHNFQQSCTQPFIGRCRAPKPLTPASQALRPTVQWRTACKGGSSRSSAGSGGGCRGCWGAVAGTGAGGGAPSSGATGASPGWPTSGAASGAATGAANGDPKRLGSYSRPHGPGPGPGFTGPGFTGTAAPTSDQPETPVSAAAPWMRSLMSMLINCVGPSLQQRQLAAASVVSYSSDMTLLLQSATAAGEHTAACRVAQSSGQAPTDSLYRRSRVPAQQAKVMATGK